MRSGLIALCLGLSFAVSCMPKSKASQAKSTSVLIAVTIVPFLVQSMQAIIFHEEMDLFTALGKKLRQLVIDPADLAEHTSALAVQEAQALAIKLDQNFAETYAPKIKALQQMMTVDYVPGVADSSAVIAHMLSASNDLEAGLEAYLRDPKDTAKVGLAIATYQTYLLSATFKATIAAERVYQASKTPGGDPAGVAALKQAQAASATSQKLYLARLQTAANDYAATTEVVYTANHRAETTDLGVGKQVHVSYCGSLPSGAKACGRESGTVCSSSYSPDCLKQAEDEAKAIFIAENLPALQAEFQHQAFGTDLVDYSKYLGDLIASTRASSAAGSDASSRDSRDGQSTEHPETIDGAVSSDHAVDRPAAR